MKKTKLFGTLLMAACLAAGTLVPSVPASADGMKVVTLGADLTEDQMNTMLQYFQVSEDEVQILYITNEDEREHLSSYVPLEQIGTRTVSCAYVKPTTSGGIKVRTANLNWVTCNMIASCLSTSGVTNCEVVAACPFEVSGTGALTGIQMAYETASGETLDETKKELATEEIVVTGNLAEQVGTDEATSVINQSKMEVIAGDVQNADEINNIVINAASDAGVTLTDDEVSTITDLLAEIVQQDYDYSAMEETLERVEENVTGEIGAADVVVSEEDGDTIISEEDGDTIISEEDGDEIVSEEEDGDSIVSGLDESILGSNVITGSTEDPTLSAETAGVEETTATGSDDAISESGDMLVIEEETVYETYAAEGTAAETEYYDDTEEDVDITETDTSYLDEESQSKFDKAMTFCKAEYLNDADCQTQILETWDLTPSVTYLDETLGNELLNAVMKDYLGILGNGTDSYEADGTEKYFTAELNLLDEDLQKIFGINLTDEEKAEEGADLLGDSYTEEEKATLYEETMIFFEKLYGESYYDETMAVEETEMYEETTSYEETSSYEETDEDEIYEEDTTYGEDDMIVE